MQGVFTTSNTCVYVCDLPLRFLGDGVRCRDVVGQKQCIAGLFEDGGLDDYVRGMGGD